MWGVRALNPAGWKHEACRLKGVGGDPRLNLLKQTPKTTLTPDHLEQLNRGLSLEISGSWLVLGPEES